MKKIILVETPSNKHGQSNKVYKRTLAASRAEQIFSEHVILRRLARISRDGVGGGGGGWVGGGDGGCGYEGCEDRGNAGGGGVGGERGRTETLAELAIAMRDIT